VTAALIRLRLGALQLSALEIYVSDVAHDDDTPTWPGRVVGDRLELPAEAQEAAVERLHAASNSAGAGGGRSGADGADRVLARVLGDLAHRVRLARPSTIPPSAGPGEYRLRSGRRTGKLVR
jgi:hypothetical protein